MILYPSVIDYKILPREHQLQAKLLLAVILP